MFDLSNLPKITNSVDCYPNMSNREEMYDKFGPVYYKIFNYLDEPEMVFNG